MPGREFHTVRSVGIFGDEFTAVILIGMREEQGRGKIRANARTRSRHLPNRVIDMRPEGLPASNK